MGKAAGGKKGSQVGIACGGEADVPPKVRREGAQGEVSPPVAWISEASS